MALTKLEMLILYGCWEKNAYACVASSHLIDLLSQSTIKIVIQTVKVYIFTSLSIIKQSIIVVDRIGHFYGN